MTIQEAHQDFKLKLNRLASNSLPDMTPAEIDWLLNEAQILYIKQKFDPRSNTKFRGFQASVKRLHDLQKLHIKDSAYGSNVSPLDLSVIPDLLFVLRGDLITSDPCNPRMPLRYVESDDLSEVRKDPFVTQDYALFEIANDQLYIHSKVPYSNVYIDWIRKPIPVSLGTYTYIDGTVRPAQGFELADHTHPEIVDLAALLAANNAFESEYIGPKAAKININE